jgi:uracil-DNA glycosylase family 4
MSDPASQVRASDLAAQLRTRVEYDRELGVLGYPRAAPRVGTQPAATPAAAPRAPAPHASASAPVARAAATPDLLAAPGLAETGSLDELRTFIGDCRRCKLAGHRTQIVFGVGNPRARLVFAGEAPGRDEDLKGEPFVGRAGQLLTEIITKGMRLRREDVYIANVIKCRPPENRNPEPDEVASCEPFLIRQLELIRPEVIVALGKFAVQTLLGTKEAITRLRGRWHDYHGIPLMPTFHPAYLLRNPAEKRVVWEDIQTVMKRLGIDVARK